jgi:hypothetical protein
MHTWISRHPDDGRYILTNGYDWTYFTVDDVPYFVRSLRVEVDRIELALSDETTELWRPDRSWIGPNDAIYTHVKDTSPRGSFEARFTRHAQTSLSSVLEADPKEECVWVVLGQTRTPLRPRHLAGDTSDATLLHSG